MMDEENKIVETQAVPTLVDTSQGEPHKRRVHRPKRRLKRKAVALLTGEQQERSSPLLLSAAANLVLLIAIFAIVFAAHRAIQSKRQALVIVPDDLVSAIKSAPTSETAQVVEVKVEQPKTAELKSTVVKPGRQKRYVDPYTSGGPLDLDRRTDFHNPWNSGSHGDLDSESVRQKYKKHYLSSNNSDK